MPASPRAYKVGYARVSSSAQKLDAQFDALKQTGCHKVFSDRVSGIKADRPGWAQLRLCWLMQKHAGKQSCIRLLQTGKSE